MFYSLSVKKHFVRRFSVLITVDYVSEVDLKKKNSTRPLSCDNDFNNLRKV